MSLKEWSNKYNRPFQEPLDGWRGHILEIRPSDPGYKDLFALSDFYAEIRSIHPDGSQLVIVCLRS